jgi:hypothetical protein
MRYVLLLTCLLMLVGNAVKAQEQETIQEETVVEETGRQSDRDETVVTESNDFRMYSEPEETHEGDTVVLTDGRRLENVQVLRRTSTDYEIEVVEGAPPMALPRDVVSEIVWDDYDPLGLNLGDMELSEDVATPPPLEETAATEPLTPDEEGNVEILPGKKVPAEFAGRLRKDITPLLPKLSGKGILEVFKTLAQAIQIQIVAEPPVRRIASEDDGLKVEINVDEGTTVNVAQFFYNYLFKQPKMRNLDIVYMPNRMIVTTKEAAEKMRAELDDAEEEQGSDEEETPEG